MSHKTTHFRRFTVTKAVVTANKAKVVFIFPGSWIWMKLEIADYERNSRRERKREKKNANVHTQLLVSGHNRGLASLKGIMPALSAHLNGGDDFSDT